MAKKKEIVRCYRIGTNHERVFLWEKDRKVKRLACSRRRIIETERDQEEVTPVNLNSLAADLPPELEGQWIVEVVRGFGTYRGIHADVALRDYYQAAVGAAIKAAQEAVEKCGDVTAFVKRAVRSCLANLQTYDDYRDARLENDDTKVLTRNPFGDFRTALRLLPPEVRRLWFAYRRSRGVMSAFARELGVSDYLAETRYFPVLRREIGSALGYVRFIRGRRF